MKKIFKIISVLSVMIIILTTSCSEKERTWLADLQVGAYLTFVEFPADVQGVNAISEVTFTAELYDPTGNVDSYELSISAIISGTPTAEFVLGTYTTFPLNFAMDIATLAAAVGVTTADINFGDHFAFSGVVTHKNGVVYTGVPPSYDAGDDPPLVLAGRTNAEIADPNNGYRNGFDFGFTIGCPPDTYVASTIPGDWNAFSASWPADGTVVITLDAGDDNVLLIEGMAALDGMIDTPDPMRMVVDPATNGVWVDPDVILAINFYGYDNMYLSGTGTIFPCAGNVINANLQYQVDQGSFGTYGYVFTPL